MPTYRNGYIPESLLVIFARGANTVDGSWYHGLPPATYARHLALVDKAYARTGRTLQISDGWGAYRPYAAQLVARQIYGNGAASPGTSSHGGIWEGRQTAAMDYSNWGWVYGWDRDAFAADCAAVGLTANMIVPARGYPDEPWHVIDLDPWSAVPSSGDASAFPVPVSKAVVGGKMTIYARRDDGLVVAIPEGGPTYNYASAAEYNRNRETIAVINGQRQADGQPLVTLPPVLGSIVTMTSERLNDLIRSQGAVLSPAPVVRIDVPDVVVPEIDVDKIAQKVNDEADRRARERLGS